MVPVPHTTCVFELSLELRGQVAPHRVGSAPSGLGKNRQVERKEAAPPQSPRLEAPVSQVALLRSFSQACVLGQHLTSSGVIPIHSPACCLQCTPRARCWGTQCRLRHPGHQHPASGAPSWPMGVSTGVTGLVCCLSLRVVWGGGGDSPRSPRGGRRLRGSCEGSPLPAAPGAGQIPVGVRADGAPMGRGAADGRWVCVRTRAARQAPTGTVTNRGGRGGPADRQKAWLAEPHLTCV